MRTNKEIDFLLFTVKNSKESIVDVTVDLEAREYTIEHTDLYGHTIEPEIGGKLRRKSVQAFSEKLETLDLVSYPLKKKNTLPVQLKNATLMYVIDDEVYYTDGDDQHPLSLLHKEIENLVGTTFGSYDFY